MYITEDMINAAAHALREHDMQGRITRKWEAMSNRDKKKWLVKARLALEAALDSFNEESK